VLEATDLSPSPTILTDLDLRATRVPVAIKDNVPISPRAADIKGSVHIKDLLRAAAIRVRDPIPPASPAAIPVDPDLKVRALLADIVPAILLKGDLVEGRATFRVDRVREATEHEDPRVAPRRWILEEPDSASRAPARREPLSAGRTWS
jgi:hypothetical protein